ncbi:type III pantothenate kinase [Pontibacter sp. G13]|uniref:type III pantothenate kinase n=1 Tax=Pontibacter sp. G13 TaxID=3074898 RepID=UPI00288C052C|nr:type III pantothenate kinase [Pontibacter sp. G13]WNJ16158.1 type III pantothenate kinase [Pontibacter sp. G13]
MQASSSYLLAIDIGNTRSKAALFHQGAMVSDGSMETETLEQGIGEYLKHIDSAVELQIGWVSVAQTIDPNSWNCLTRFSKVELHEIDHRYPLPIGNAYATPETLGMDRIVAAIGAKQQVIDDPVLVIDAGTAITYDAVDAERVYQGGGIAPGVSMRFRALNAFTARLPLVQAQLDVPLVGDSTESSIRTGVINGTRMEISGTIEAYQGVYGQNLKVFLTGGDSALFENHVKNINFADSKLILKGIFHILTHPSHL